MKRAQASGPDCHAETELELVQCKKTKFVMAPLVPMPQYIFPLEVLYTIMKYVDLKTFKSFCKVIFDTFGIREVQAGEFTKYSATLSRTQAMILYNISELFGKLNNTKSGSWSLPIINDIQSKLRWIHYCDSYNGYTELTMDKLEVDLNLIQNRIVTLKKSTAMNFCYSEICVHCSTRCATKSYYTFSENPIHLCIYCYRHMQDNLITDEIDNKLLASGHAWVSQKAIKNSLLFKGKNMRKWLIDNNIRVYHNSMDFAFARPPKTKYYLLSDIIETINKNRETVVYFVVLSLPS